MSKSQQVLITFAHFARSLGAHDRITREASLVWHKEYVKANAATRAARREEFILNFMQGYGYTATRAAKVMAQSRTERSKGDGDVYEAARSKFDYHVVRRAKDAASSKHTDPVAKLLADYAALSAGEKRSFKAKLAAL